MAYYVVKWVQTFCIFFAYEIFNNSESFLTDPDADPDGLMVEINTYDPILFLDLPPG